MSKAIYAGSFDPLTNGHVWMIKKAASLFNELIIAVGVNPDKKYRYSEKARLDCLKNFLETLPKSGLNGEPQHITVDVTRNQYLVDYATTQKADFLVRGIRNATDLEYERTMRHVNERISPTGIQTVFLMPPKDIEDISSSFVKGMIGPPGWTHKVRDMVPAQTLDLIFRDEAHRRWTSLWGSGRFQYVEGIL